MESERKSDTFGGKKPEKLQFLIIPFRSYLNKALPVLTLVVFSWLLFGQFTVAEKPILRNYIIFPLLVWLAFKFTWRGMMNALFLCSIIAIWNTWLGHGIFGFAGQTRIENLFSLLMFLTVIIFSGLFLNTLISKQKRIENALRKSESKFRTVADFTYDWEYWNGKNDKILYMSPSCERISGYSPEDFLADNSLLKKIIHPEDMELFSAHLEKVHSSNNIHASEKTDFRIIKKDGSIAHIYHICTPVYEDDGSYSGRRISNRDITERRKFEKRIEHLASFPEMNPNPVIELDMDSNITYLNPSAKNILQNMAGQERANPLIPDDIKTIISSMILNKNEVKKEIALKDSIFIESFNFIESSGSIRIYLYDITQLRTAEKELLEAQEKLRLNTEKQLIESYQHLGIMNRRISLIADMERYCLSKRDRNDVADYILASVTTLCNASASFLFVSADQKNFSLFAEKTQKARAIQRINYQSSYLLRQLINFKQRINGDIKIYQHDLLEDLDKLSYFIALPLTKGNSLKGFLFLGMENIKSMETDDLEFLDVFAKSASDSMIKMRVLK